MDDSAGIGEAFRRAFTGRERGMPLLRADIAHCLQTLDAID